MIWILLLYVLPLVLSILGAYYIVKSDGGSIKDFLEPLPFLLIPLFNIFALIVGLYTVISVWIEEDESWQNFKNRKL